MKRIVGSARVSTKKHESVSLKEGGKGKIDIRCKDGHYLIERIFLKEKVRNEGDTGKKKSTKVLNQKC